MNKKTFRRLHLWMAAPLGLIFALIAFSGAMLVWEQDATRWLHPERFKIEQPGQQALPPERLVANVVAVIPDSVRVTGITVSAHPAVPTQILLSHPRRAVMYVNQYTGQVIERNERVPFFDTMFRLHRWLLDNYKRGEFSFGKLLVGIATLMALCALLSGIFLWWPRKFKALRQQLTIKTGRGQHSFFYSLHSVAGAYAALLLLLMAATGLTWSFDWYRTGLYALFGVESQEHGHGRATKGKGSIGQPPHEQKTAKSQMPASVVLWDEVVAQMAQRQPQYKSITVEDGTAKAALKGWGNTRAADEAQYDTTTGRLGRYTPYAQTDKADRLNAWLHVLHMGQWGGYFSRGLYFLAALIGALLPLTGYYLWAKRTARRRQR